jgi:hypothetical protein
LRRETETEEEQVTFASLSRFLDGECGLLAKALNDGMVLDVHRLWFFSPPSSWWGVTTILSTVLGGLRMMKVERGGLLEGSSFQFGRRVLSRREEGLPLVILGAYWSLMAMARREWLSLLDDGRWGTEKRRWMQGLWLINGSFGLWFPSSLSPHLLLLALLDDLLLSSDSIIFGSFQLPVAAWEEKRRSRSWHTPGGCPPSLSSSSSPRFESAVPLCAPPQLLSAES